MQKGVNLNTFKTNGYFATQIFMVKTMSRFLLKNIHGFMEFILNEFFLLPKKEYFNCHFENKRQKSNFV